MNQPAHMRALTGERLLAACEEAQEQHALMRPLTLLAAAMPSQDRSELLDLPMDERDRLLLQMRQLSFGPVLHGYAACTLCGTAMEFSLHIAAALEAMSEPALTASVAWQDDGMDLQLRQATTADLLACSATPTVEQAVRSLLARCLRVDESSEEATRRAALPSVRAHFDQLHAGCEWRCALCCPQCAHADTWDLDLGHFLWMEARHAARKLLSDIHMLALHYGWSESAIVALSHQRRRAYLELLSA